MRKLWCYSFAVPESKAELPGFGQHESKIAANRREETIPDRDASHQRVGRRGRVFLPSQRTNPQILLPIVNLIERAS